MITRAVRHVRSWLRVKPIPITYRGVRMSSTLEADWACTFDSLGWQWSYEPIGVQLSDGQWYRCDFFLPIMNVWCEVKGPHDLRIDKPLKLWRDLRGDESEWRAPLVVVCREPMMGDAVVHRADGGPISIAECGRCNHYTFVDLDGTWQCRVCGFWEERTGYAGGVATAWRAQTVPFAPVEYNRWRAA